MTTRCSLLCIFILAGLASGSSSGASADHERAVESPSLSSTAVARMTTQEDDQEGQAIAHVLTELEHQVDAVLSKLGKAAEIDIDVVLDESWSGMGSWDEDGEADELDRDEGMAVVATRPLAEKDFEANQTNVAATANATGAKSDAGVSKATRFAPPTATASAKPALKRLRQQWPVDNEWEFLAPRWGALGRNRFDRRQVGPVTLSMLTAMSCVTLLLVLSVWSLSRRARRRSVERQEAWAASVEYLDASEHQYESRYAA